jgi:hypothetical protein
MTLYARLNSRLRVEPKLAAEPVPFAAISTREPRIVTSARSEKTVASKSAAGELHSGFRLLFHPGIDEIEAYLRNRLRGSARYEIYQHLKQCSHCKYTFYQLVRQREFAKQQLTAVTSAPMQSSNAYRV